MKSVFGATVWVGVGLPAAAAIHADDVQAGFLEAGNANLFHARQTARHHPHRLGDRAPAPTPAPKMLPPSDHVLDKRGSNNNTIGFIPGLDSWAITCPLEWFSTIQSSRGVVGCCQDGPTTTTPCIGYVTCLDSSEKASYTTDNGFTRYCGYSKYPYCYRWGFPDESYTLWNCDSTPYGSGTLCSTPGPVTVLSTSTWAGPKGVLIWKTTVPVSTVAHTAGQPGFDSQGQEPGQEPGQGQHGQQPSQAQESSNVSVIVGGVIGGIAILAILVFSLAFLVYRSRKADKANPTTNIAYNGGGPPVGSPGPGPHPEAGVDQYTRYGGYAPVVAQSPDVAVGNRKSTFKPPVGFGAVVAPQTGGNQSPQPHNHQQQQPPPPQYAGQVCEMPIEHDQRPYGLQEVA
ncbi:hypothetical protein MAPG_09968 [Magnaporthiopsis poae ATCC 64411]|uniref:Mid2 domain-containing protein n=1 Tax=Magnaporthiopsis poae (strain ATCC 64411 / 73-15) TaxID=644358 RepID=A0A0C4EBC0_MAGP6|nr:hypothetical protein MAPG_09968 [Magnaporthiopsis poae ATCC 64411]